MGVGVRGTRVIATVAPTVTAVGVFAGMRKETPLLTTVRVALMLMKSTELGRICVRVLPGKPGTNASYSPVVGFKALAWMSWPEAISSAKAISTGTAPGAGVGVGVGAGGGGAGAKTCQRAE